MKLIVTPRLRLAQLQTFAESTITICQDIPSLETARITVTNVLEKLKKGMIRDQASADKKQQLDNIRDKYNSGFFAAIDSESLFPHNDQQAIQTITDLNSLTNKYGYKLNRWSYDEETAQIDNMLADITKIDLSPLNGTGIARWIPLLQEANNSFKSATSEYISDSAEVSTSAAAGSYALELKKALDNLFTILFALATLDPSEELITAYNELETLVEAQK